MSGQTRHLDAAGRRIPDISLTDQNTIDEAINTLSDLLDHARGQSDAFTNDEQIEATRAGLRDALAVVARFKRRCPR